MIMVIVPGGPAIHFESRCHGKSEKKRGGLCWERSSEHVAAGWQRGGGSCVEAGDLSSRNEEDPG